MGRPTFFLCLACSSSRGRDQEGSRLGGPAACGGRAAQHGNSTSQPDVMAAEQLPTMCSVELQHRGSKQTVAGQHSLSPLGPAAPAYCQAARPAPASQSSGQQWPRSRDSTMCWRVDPAQLSATFMLMLMQAAIASDSPCPLRALLSSSSHCGGMQCR